MADLDDLREGSNFGLNIATQQQHFILLLLNDNLVVSS